MICDILVKETFSMIVRVEADGGDEAREKARDAAELRLLTAGDTYGMTTVIVDAYGEPPDSSAGVDLDTTRKEE